jgi:hypothetical protein
MEKLDGERFAFLAELRRGEALPRRFEGREGGRECPGTELGAGAAKKRRFFLESTRCELRFRSGKARYRRRARGSFARCLLIGSNSGRTVRR